MGSSEAGRAEDARTDEAFRAGGANYRLLVEHLHAGVVVHGPDTRILLANRQASILLGLSLDQMQGRVALDPYWSFVREDGSVLPFEDFPVNRVIATAQPLRDLCVGINRPATRDRVWVLVNAYPELQETGALRQVVVTFVDITDLKRAESERQQLQIQLVQAQKMESIGRLAGGVAHDFNNMLQAILGNAQMALDVLPPDSPARDQLLEVRRSAERSADLTRQLLAFARKQPIQPRVLYLNDTVEKALKMLRRLLGEELELVWSPGAELWPTKADPSQLDNVLANLCVNARDATVGQGRVSIETRNVELDEAFTAAHPEALPGPHVLLSVRDNGSGMDAETRARIFEPFFTTKGLGKGTGLGLASVFGMVRQSHGLITVESEVGFGTIFRIFLPRAVEAVADAGPASATEAPRSGHRETILLVEDEAPVLDLCRQVLEQHAYRVLPAASPAAALTVAERHAGRIDVLLTDVVMPGMDGRELQQHLKAIHPETKCLFMSGYTADLVARHGVAAGNVDLLLKPFGNQELVDRVRDLLSRA